MALLPSQAWWRWTAFADRWESPLIPWSGRPSCLPCGGGWVFPASSGASGWGADRLAGGPARDSVPRAVRLARRGFDRWPCGSPLPLPAREEVAREAFWETLPLYLWDQNRGGTLENQQDTKLNGDSVTDSVTLIQIG